MDGAASWMDGASAPSINLLLWRWTNERDGMRRRESVGGNEPSRYPPGVTKERNGFITAEPRNPGTPEPGVPSPEPRACMHDPDFLADFPGRPCEGVRGTCPEDLVPTWHRRHIGIIYFTDMCSICILSVNPYCLPFQSGVSCPTRSRLFLPLVLHKYANKTDKDRFCGPIPDSAKRFMVPYIGGRSQLGRPLFG